MEVSSTIQLLVFPRDDEALDARLADIGAEHGWERMAPADLQQRLRVFYPDAVVRERDPLGDLDARRPAWYVYRDGSPRSS